MSKGVNMIKYKIDIVQQLKDNGYNTNQIRQQKLVSESTMSKLRHNDTSITLANIDTICKLLRCQPTDLIEYVPDELTIEQSNLSTGQESIPRRLFDLRTQAGYTQTQVAKELGVDYPLYISYENGTENATLNFLLKACKLYNVPQSYFEINNNLSAVGNKGYYVNQTDNSDSISVSADEFIAVQQFLDIYRKREGVNKNFQ